MRVCASCGKENPDEARFCLACGTPFTAERAHREVRKTVTILFADVTGSTALGERLDPESLRRVMSRYFEEMRSVIERHGGTVEKFIGDAVMAVFGIPTLHEDDALRAVRAAAEMREALDSLNRELERDRGVAIAVRTGVNTGEVVAGDPSAGQSMVIGDAVNVAARFEQAAGPGEVLLGEATYRLVRDAVEVQPVDPLPLKGKAEPVRAYRLLAVTPGAAGTARRMDSPMIGRNRERSLLDQAFDRATSERACHLFTVLGSPGVGKTRLVSEFLGQARERAQVLSGRCLPYGEGITFWPVIEVIREAAGITEGDTPEQARSRLAALCTGEEQALLVTELVGQVLGLSEAAAPAEETFWAIRKLLEALARRQPLVVEFDDIHWGEPTFLDLVEHIADWTRDAPILLLCLARPDLLDHRPGWGGGKMNATSILLEPLSDAECERLMANLLGQAGLAETVRDRITEAAEGNPLFVEEMLSMLIDDGLLQRSDGHWEAVTDLSQVSVPPNIRALITARLDRLAAEERAVIERASVEGRIFHRGAVAELSPEPDRTEAPRHLMALVRKELIRPDRAEFPGEDAFRFRHMLIRDSAYDSLPKEARAELHERFAEWMERAAGDRAVEYEEIIGWHLEQAYRYRSELGPVDDRGRALADRAAARLAAAGRRARDRGDVGAMAKLFDRATALMPSDSPARIDLLPDLGVALGALGEFRRAEQVLDEAVTAGDAVGQRGLATRARMDRAFLRLTTTSDAAGGAQALEETERAIEVFEELEDQARLARAWLLKGVVLFWRGRAAEAEGCLERSAELAARTGDAQSMADSVVWFASIALWGPTPVEEGLHRGEDLWDMVRGRAAEASFLLSRGALFGMKGRFDEGRTLQEGALSIGRDLGLRVLTASCHPVAELELDAGNYQGVVDRLNPGLEVLRSIGEKGYLSTSAAYVAEGLYGLGRYDEAAALSRESEEASASDDIASQVAWRSVRAKVLARRGELEEADRLSQQAVEIASDTDHLIVITAALMSRAEVLRLAARAKDAIPEVERALELYERKGHLVGARRARGLLDELRSGPPGG